MEVNEILARELFVFGGGKGSDQDVSRNIWNALSPKIRGAWEFEANQIRLALAAEGVFVMRSRDA